MDMSLHGGIWQKEEILKQLVKWKHNCFVLGSLSDL